MIFNRLLRSRVSRYTPVVTMVVLLFGGDASSTLAQCDSSVVCSPSISVFSAVEDGNGNELENTCGAFGGLKCAMPKRVSVEYLKLLSSCNPLLGSCDMRALVEVYYKGNRLNVCSSVVATAGGHYLVDGVVKQRCGVFANNESVDTDYATFTVNASFTCGDPTVHEFQAVVCPSVAGCDKDLMIPLDFEGSAAAGCPAPPRKTDCRGGNDCKQCKIVGPGGTDVTDGQPVVRGDAAGLGPGTYLHYAAGGTGASGSPGEADWAAKLGRFWSHDYAERLVSDSGDDSHVWLLTRFGSFREFTDNEPDGIYDVASPSDEFRELEKTIDGWTLRDLDGTVTYFDTAGAWDRTVYRNGAAVGAEAENTKQGFYNGLGQLDLVTFPDGTREVFTYYVGGPSDGKLLSIQQVGVEAGGSPADCSPAEECRTWTFSWTGDNLTKVERPDDRDVEIFYGDAQFPNLVTRMDLVGISLGRRVLTAWEYDASGMVFRMWRGHTDFNHVDAVDQWVFTYDDASAPTLTSVTDALGNPPATFVIEQVSGDAPRLISVTDDCPSCGSGPNVIYDYSTSQHPQLPNKVTDGRGIETEFVYNPNGQVTMRTEALGETEQRITTYDYDLNFPALLILRQRNSTSNGFRSEVLTYDSESGDLLSRVVEGREDRLDDGDPVDTSFSLTTNYTGYNSVGRFGTIDPPGPQAGATGDATDATIRTYLVPGRNGWLADATTSPMGLTTNFTYDALNRRAVTQDPNGESTETQFDEANRVTKVIQRASGFLPGDPVNPGDLETRNEYNEFGDLFQTILPEGNVVEYGYDGAGRLETIVRRNAADTSKERTVFGYDDVGNRIEERSETWDGGVWVESSKTGYQYSTRCHLDKMIHNPDALPAEQIVTEYDYDCNGNLERTWDANHPSAGQTAPATATNVYDKLNRLTEVQQPWGGAGGGTATTIYGYDFQDHLVSVTDAEGNATTYTYSDRDLLTSEISPVAGTTLHTYNKHGQLLETEDARGNKQVRTVDVLDRMTTVDYLTGGTTSVPSLLTQYSYDVGGAGCYPVGRLMSIARDGESIDYCYDRFGRQTQDGELAYGYDDNGNRRSVTYPAASGTVKAVYGFDFSDRQTTLEVETPAVVAPGTSIVSSATYLASGPLASLGLGNGALRRPWL